LIGFCPDDQEKPEWLHRAGKTVHRAGKMVHRAGKTVHRAGKMVHHAGETVHRAGKMVHHAGETVHCAGKTVHDYSKQCSNLYLFNVQQFILHIFHNSTIALNYCSGLLLYKKQVAPTAAPCLYGNAKCLLSLYRTVYGKKILEWDNFKMSCEIIFQLIVMNSKPFTFRLVLFLTDLCCAIGPTKTNLISRVGNF
jgi:hypothetical protein